MTTRWQVFWRQVRKGNWRFARLILGNGWCPNLRKPPKSGSVWAVLIVTLLIHIVVVIAHGEGSRRRVPIAEPRFMLSPEYIVIRNTPLYIHGLVLGKSEDPLRKGKPSKQEAYTKCGNRRLSYAFLSGVLAVCFSLIVLFRLGIKSDFRSKRADLQLFVAFLVGAYGVYAISQYLLDVLEPLDNCGIVIHGGDTVPHKYTLTTPNYWGTVIAIGATPMANVLKAEKQTAIIGALAEGSSIRSIERMTGVHRDTIMRLGVRIGKGCQTLLDHKMRGLSCQRLQFIVEEAFRSGNEKRFPTAQVSQSADKERG